MVVELYRRAQENGYRLSGSPHCVTLTPVDTVEHTHQFSNLTFVTHSHPIRKETTEMHIAKIIPIQQAKCVVTIQTKRAIIIIS